MGGERVRGARAECSGADDQDALVTKCRDAHDTLPRSSDGLSRVQDAQAQRAAWTSGRGKMYRKAQDARPSRALKVAVT
jgi:hypothetical protein